MRRDEPCATVLIRDSCYRDQPPVVHCGKAGAMTTGASSQSEEAAAHHEPQAPIPIFFMLLPLESCNIQRILLGFECSAVCRSIHVYRSIRRM